MGGAPNSRHKEAIHLPEPEEVAALTAPDVQPEAQPAVTEPTETAPPTRAELAEAIAALEQKLNSSHKTDFDSAYKAARRSESKGDSANAKIAKLEAQLESLATRGMDDQEAKLWKAERALERANESSQTVSQQQEYEQAARSFQERSQSYLSGEGIKADDPRLTAAFSEFAKGAQRYEDWDMAMVKAVAVVHKDERKRLETDSKTREDKIREEERAKLRNERRTNDGPIDKGTPASTSSKPVKDMSTAEFAEYERQKDAERIRRRRAL